MKKRTVQYVVYILGALILLGAYVALVLTDVIPVRSGGNGFGLVVLWNGLCQMLDWHPQFQERDRWERQVYGLAGVWMGGATVAMSALISQANALLFVILTFVPPVLIALIGRLWYVEKKRSQAWKKQNQTEKD